MEKLKLLKSVVFRTKSFKALLLGGLIIGCIVTQYPSASNKPKTEIDKQEFIPLIVEEPSTIIPVKKAEVIDGQYFMSNKHLISSFSNFHKNISMSIGSDSKKRCHLINTLKLKILRVVKILKEFVNI